MLNFQASQQVVTDNPPGALATPSSPDYLRNVTEEMQSLRRLGEPTKAFILGRGIYRETTRHGSLVDRHYLAELAEAAVEALGIEKPELAHRYIDRALRAIEEMSPSAQLESAILNVLHGEVEYLQGSYFKAREFFELADVGYESCSKFERDGRIEEYRAFLNLSALTLAELGDISQSDRRFARLLQSFDGISLEEATIRINYSSILLKRGELGDAGAYIQPAIKFFEENPSSENARLSADCYSLYSTTCVSAKRYAEAEIYIVRAEELLISIDTGEAYSKETLSAKVAKAWISLLRGRTEEADRFFVIESGRLENAFQELDLGRVKFFATRERATATTVELIREILSGYATSGIALTPDSVRDALIANGFEHRIPTFLPIDIDFASMSSRDFLQHLDDMAQTLIEEAISDSEKASDYFQALA